MLIILIIYIIIYYILYKYKEETLLSPYPSHSLPEETIMSIFCKSFKKSHALVLSYLILTVFHVQCTHIHTCVYLFIHDWGERDGVCTIGVLST